MENKCNGQCNCQQHIKVCSCDWEVKECGCKKCKKCGKIENKVQYVYPNTYHQYIYPNYNVSIGDGYYVYVWNGVSYVLVGWKT